jgi:hypothetical protein
MAKTYKKSASGFYRVELARPFPRRGFTYKPGQRIRASQAVLDEMIVADVVSNVTPD